MEEVKGECFQPLSLPPYGEPETPGEAPIPLRGQCTLRPIPLKPTPSETPIVAVDVSSLTIGETEAGVLCAVRGAVVWKADGRYRYLRLGPFPFHITEENKAEIYNFLRRLYFASSKEVRAPSLVNMQARIGNLLERWIQMSVCNTFQGSIILWDGSLTAGTVDSPVHVVSHLLDVARSRLNTVLAFSKMTRLRLWGRRLTDLVRDYPPPCLLEVDGYALPSSPIRFLGRIYVAKFTRGGYSFRLDVDHRLPEERGLRAIEQLLGNDLVVQGYPETLRLAHIFSTFTANEVIGIQRFVAKRYGLRIINRLNVHRILFGPFGKGVEVGT